MQSSGITYIVPSTTLIHDILPNLPDHAFAAGETIADTYRQAECAAECGDICIIDNSETFCSPYHQSDIALILQGRTDGTTSVLIIPASGDLFIVAVINPTAGA